MLVLVVWHGRRVDHLMAHRVPCRKPPWLALLLQLGAPMLAVVRGYGDANQDPQWFTTAPAAAAPKVSYVMYSELVRQPSTTGSLLP
jgi:hypothetical protein